MPFRKYMHVERFGNDEVQGIELGGCYVFPKLDGTNASVWWDEDDVFIGAGSRKRPLRPDDDNAGFCSFAFDSTGIIRCCEENPTWNIYGEWLVPHSLKTYRDDAWRKFYIFDVWDNDTEKYLSYDEYQPELNEYGLDYIIPLCVINNATYENLLVELDNNKFLIEDGMGSGEGVVIKNYQFQNRFGRTVWAKIITNTFKEKHIKEMGATVKNMKEMTEQKIVDDYVDSHLVDKAYAKIANENNGWNSKDIPRLLSTVFYDLVNEEIWNVVKKLKNPTINFKTLHHLTISRVKELKPEIF